MQIEDSNDVGDNKKDIYVRLKHYNNFSKSLKIIKSLKCDMNLFILRCKDYSSLVLECLDSNDFSYYFRSEIEIPDSDIMNLTKNEYYIGPIDINVMILLLSHTNAPSLLLQQDKHDKKHLKFIEEIKNESIKTVIKLNFLEEKKLKSIQKLSYDFNISIKISDLLHMCTIGCNKNIGASCIEICINKDSEDNCSSTFKVESENTTMIRKFGKNIDNEKNDTIQQRFELLKMFKVLKVLDGSTNVIHLKLSEKKNPLLIYAEYGFGNSFVSMLLPVL